MRKTLLLRGFLALAASSMLLGGCVYRERVVYREPVAGGAQTEVEVEEAPPAPIVEDIGIAPAPGFVWIGGFWGWHDHWVWERGHWGRPPYRGAVWIGPRYVVRGGRHVWIGGRWR